MAHNSELKCDVIGFTYEFGAKSATFFVAYDNCTDMTGAIAICTRLDPDCREILVYGAGDGAGDILYRKDKTGWRAYDYDRASIVEAVEKQLSGRLEGLGADVKLENGELIVGKSARH